MGKVGGFLEHPRRDPEKEPPAERVRHGREFERRLPVLAAREQGARCMDCGVPTCHAACPLGNRIPDWNDLVYRDRWRAGLASLEATNPMPEVTGRVCPAPCEAACVLEPSGAPVSIKALEHALADRGWEEGSVQPQRPARRTGRRVAVVGSGPAGLACAQALVRAGHDVQVLERDDRAGGLLRYGIPDFKLEKRVLERRLALLREEGVELRTGVEVGRDVTLAALRASHDAVVLAVGATVPRELAVPGRELAGVHLAMRYLVHANRRAEGEAPLAELDARGKRVVVLGGGDTGSDCLGTALRQGALSVLQLELAPEPPAQRSEGTPWPAWPHQWRVSSSQQEGGERHFAVRTVELEGEEGRVRALRAVRDAGPSRGEALRWEVDLVLLAMGFSGAEGRVLEGTPLGLDARGRLRGAEGGFATEVPGVFSCGDARRGQSLVVWALWEGLACARAVDLALQGSSALASMPEARLPF